MAIVLIYCADGNPSFAKEAVRLGWEYGARLPSTVYQRVYFADQDWKCPDRTAYMKALSKHRPVMATVLDWEREEQLPEVLSWAKEAARYVREYVVVIPKVIGGVSEIPRTIGGKQIVLGYSVPTSYGGTTVHLTEFFGRSVHLLGGSPHRQMDLYMRLRNRCDVVSADGNMAHQQAHRCRVWCDGYNPKGHWVQLSELGHHAKEGANLEAFRRSLVNIRTAWQKVVDSGKTRGVRAVFF